jgi:hypothetical protein
MRRSLRRADGQPRSPGEIPDLAGQISVIGTLTGFGIDNDSGCSSDTGVRPENPELCNAKFLGADCTTGVGLGGSTRSYRRPLLRQFHSSEIGQ